MCSIILLLNIDQYCDHFHFPLRYLFDSVVIWILLNTTYYNLFSAISTAVVDKKLFVLVGEPTDIGHVCGWNIKSRNFSILPARLAWEKVQCSAEYVTICLSVDITRYQ